MKKRLLLVCMLTVVSLILTAHFALAENTVNPVCVIKTSMGDITLELFVAQAPKTVQNFIDLAEGKKSTEAGKKNFYDDLIFHRVIKDFMIQGGCPNRDGTGGPGYRFEDEINANDLGLDKIKAVDPEGKVHPYLLVRSREDYFRTVVMPLARKMKIESQQEFQARIQEIQQRISEMSLKDCYENLGYHYNDTLRSSALKRGVIAMANSGPNTNGSQFFINLADTPWLTGKHTVFGKVVQGMEVVDKIGAVAVNQRSKPEKDVTILSIRLQK